MAAAAPPPAAGGSDGAAAELNQQPAPFKLEVGTL